MTRAGLIVLVVLGGAAALPAQDVPKSADPRLVVELFAQAPDIVHPVGAVCDRKGRLLVIESHTHFRPKDYQGPKTDRVRLLEDTDGDGKADKFTTFFEGTRATMDIALHPDGSIYLATRNEILRLRDSKGDGVADEKQRIVFLDTKGDYPHNGLSGLAFDSKGNLYFGMGENLGAAYKISGADGVTLSGEGDGGSIFWCTAEGKQLRRHARGFWNPFGVCTDIFGRVFAVDNDADAMPPCRMLHVVEGGDYGYQFRYGRSGRHPFQAWNGQLPGTLPMMTGTGEAPCEIVSYESDGLPKEYLGQLLVASWADHRVERYVVTDKGASVTAERKPFIQGGKDFRPVGIAVAPDGSLYVSDWVLRDYNLHGKGAVWRVRMKEPTQSDRPADPKQALLSLHRPLREAAAQKLAATPEGRTFLRGQALHENVRVRAAVLTALADAQDLEFDPQPMAAQETVTPLLARAVRAVVHRGHDPGPYLKSPPVLLEAMSKRQPAELVALLADPDPFIRQAAIRHLGYWSRELQRIDARTLTDPRQRANLLVARGTGGPAGAFEAALTDPDEEVRFLAAKIVADEQLRSFRPQVVAALQEPKLSVRLYFAFTTALARIDGQDVSEGRMADYFFTRLTEADGAPALKIAALQLVPTTHKKLTLDVLAALLKDSDAGVRREAVRALSEHPSTGRFPLLLEVARDRQYDVNTRAEALVGLAERAVAERAVLMEFANGTQPILRDEALRALVGVKLEVGKQERPSDLIARVLGEPFAKDRPKPDDTAAWLKRLDGPADADAGRRIFFHTRLAACARCHRVDGRGADVGPDLSSIGRTERRHILESILQPDLIVAPHFQNWAIVTDDGKAHTGMLVHTNLDDYTYLDAKGGRFKLNTRSIVDSQPITASIMPTGLPDLLTDQELRDLLAFLTTRK